MKLIVANWKMNPDTVEEAREIASRIEQGVLGQERRNVETVICPPFVFIPVLRHVLHFAKLGSQDISAEARGAYTGQISARQLQEFGVKFAIVGHSERRLLGEDDKQINRKIKNALACSVEPILCVGYGSNKKSSIATVKKIIKKQLQADLKDIDLRKSKVTITYEPLWVIGTGKPASLAHCAEIKEFISEIVPGKRVIYGGSLDGQNAGAYAKAGLEGGLVGGASLKADEFLNIIKAFSN